MRPQQLIDDEEPELEQGPTCCSRLCKALFPNKEAAQKTCWVMFALFSIVLGILIAPLGDVAEELVFILVSALASIALTVTLFSRYAYFEFFPTSAIVNIGATFALSFFQIGLASADITFTKKRRALAARGEYVDDSLRLPMDILWQLVFWGTILTGTVLMTFFKMYWQSGHFTRRQRIAFALKRIKTLVLYAIIALGALTGVLLYVFEGETEKRSVLEQGVNAAMIASYTYSMVVLVLLLSHGLVKLPLYLWRTNTTTYGLI